MFSLYEQDEKFLARNVYSRSLVEKLFDGIAPVDSKVISSEQECFPAVADQLYLIKSGFMRCERKGRALFFLESGDLIGWNTLSDSLCYVSEGHVAYETFNSDQFFKLLQQGSAKWDLWRKFIDCQSQILTSLVGCDSSVSVSREPERRRHNAGAPIIIQETAANEVYTMMRGAAEVYVGEIKVGQIKIGDIFGAMAATTASRRSASVIAAEECLVSVVPKEDFLALIQTHPKTVHQLVEDMAEIIRSQNERIVGLTH